MLLMKVVLFVSLASVWASSAFGQIEEFVLPSEDLLKTGEGLAEIRIAYIGNPTDKLETIIQLIRYLDELGYQKTEDLTPSARHIEIIFVRGIDYVIFKVAEGGKYKDIRKVEIVIEKITEEVAAAIGYTGVKCGGEGCGSKSSESEEIPWETEGDE